MSEVVTGDAVVVEVRVAQMPSRAVAIIIDMAVQLPLLIAAYILLGTFAAISDPAIFGAVMIAMLVLVTVAYPVIFESISRGRSLGKLVMGLRVVSDDGSPERFRQALFRGLAGFLELWSFSGAPALISSLISQRGKRIGDIFAGTIVISERGPRDTTQLIVMPPRLASWATTLELSQLPEEVTRAARQYLVRWHDLSPQIRHEMGMRIATQAAAFVSPAAPAGVPPHAYLSAILAERRRREQLRFARQAGNGLPPQARPQTPYPQVPQPQAYQAGPYPQPQAYQPPGAPAPEPPRATPGGFAPPQ
ncbi:RDD family protein [Nonomuraea jiangxiensis]|uniref:Uncharacterized membrane protein YckC, RDD family n=1 Tax=Nonomuraea jiangxiensis TaxID=633440 RepID=A0A1G8F3K5_9ACTN|nr:RDD family protein [Nonomuraea jiangxiensis]SDH76714.1 Uncharacterized membrane protein YckC, RDD family [Nonomuraea jiangxiensis]